MKYILALVFAFCFSMPPAQADTLDTLDAPAAHELTIEAPLAPSLLMPVAFADEGEAVDLPPLPETLEDAEGLLPALIDAVVAGNYLIAGALLVMLATVAFRQYVMPKLGLGTGALPWANLGIAAIGGVAYYVTTGATPQEAAGLILLSAGLASQIWSLAGKKITEFLMGILGKKLTD